MKKIILTAVFGISLLTGLAIAQSLTDTNPNLDNPGPGRTASYVLGWNGATWARLKTASVANMPLSTSTASSVENGRLLVEKGSRWALEDGVGAGARAMVQTNAEIGVRHVVDTVCFSAGSVVAPALTSLLVELRAGAVDAGTVLMKWRIVIPAATGQNTPPVCFSGLNVIGATNSEVSLAWSAALVNLQQSVSMTGYSIF